MSRNPTLKRILRESAELASHPSADFTAAPLESDLYEWHFTLRGPPAPSAFDNGLYHGRIILPPAYPLKPPSFRFLTPSGRFEVNREICLSISGHHEETWQPAWGIRTALVAIRSFMETDGGGQIGGMQSSAEVRRRFAGQSRGWKCSSCGKTNEEVMKEVEERVGEDGGEGKKEEVPEELRLAYREDLGAKEGDGQSNGKAPEAAAVPASHPQQQSTTGVQAAQPVALTDPPTTTNASTPAQARVHDQSPAPRPQQRQQQQAVRPPQPEAIAPWIDKAIYTIVGILAYLLWRKLS